MLGLRERVDVGVEGTEDDEKDPGYGKLTGNDSLNFVANRSGEVCAELGALVKPNALVNWESGDAGRRLLRGSVLPCVTVSTGEPCCPGRGVSSSSASSEMSHTLGAPECR